MNVSDETAEPRPGQSPKDASAAAAMLRARARKFAAESPPGDTAPKLEILLVRLGEETFGIATAFVREVQRLKSLATLPGVPAFVAGVTNVRGRIVAVIDLAALLDLGQSRPANGMLVLVAHRRHEFAVMADAVLSPRSIRIDEMQTEVAGLNAARKRYLRGVTAERVVVLDAEKLVTDDSLVVNVLEQTI